MVNSIWNMLGYQALTLKGGMRGWADAHGPVEAGETEGRR
jgi:rhodanese-related sulfurtransferase